MGSNGGCGCGAAGAEPCRCERPIVPPDGVPPANGPPPVAGPAAPPAASPRGPVAAPGTLPPPYTRFDLFEEARRRGFPVAFPQDPARPPPPFATDADRLRLMAAAGPALLEPPLHPEADGRPVVEPRFAPLRPRPPAGLPLAPDGAPLDMERFFDVASPEGVVLPFDLAWPGDLPRPLVRERGVGPPAGVPADPLASARTRAHRDPLQPPEYLGLIGGPEERRLMDAPPAEEPPPRERPAPAGPPGFASSREPEEGEPRAPGQDSCAKDAHYDFPEAKPFLFTPQQPQAGGGGGGGGGEGEQKNGGVYLPGPWRDPCPCICWCIHFDDILSIFESAGRLIGSFFDLFGKDRKSLLGVSAERKVVVSTPDGFVEHVRDVVARRDVVVFGGPPSATPGAAAPLDGLSATFALVTPAPPPSAPPRLLWPELDGALAGEVRTVAPVGPGPGIPGIGMEPLAPVSGSPLRAAPGSLPAGIAPAGDSFDIDVRGRVGS